MAMIAPIANPAHHEEFLKDNNSLDSIDLGDHEDDGFQIADGDLTTDVPWYNLIMRAGESGEEENSAAKPIDEKEWDTGIESHDSSQFIGIGSITLDHCNYYNRSTNICPIGKELKISTPQPVPLFLKESKISAHDDKEREKELIEYAVEMGMTSILEKTIKDHSVHSFNLKSEMECEKSGITILTGRNGHASIKKGAPFSTCKRDESATSTPMTSKYKFLRYIKWVTLLGIATLILFYLFTLRKRAIQLEEELFRLRLQQELDREKASKLESLRVNIPMNADGYFLNAPSFKKLPSEKRHDRKLGEENFCSSSDDQLPLPFTIIDNCWIKAQASFNVGYCPRHLAESFVEKVQAVNKKWMGDSLNDFKKVVAEIARPLFPESEYVPNIVIESLNNESTEKSSTCLFDSFHQFFEEQISSIKNSLNYFKDEATKKKRRDTFCLEKMQQQLNDTADSLSKSFTQFTNQLSQGINSTTSLIADDLTYLEMRVNDVLSPSGNNETFGKVQEASIDPRAMFKSVSVIIYDTFWSLSHGDHGALLNSAAWGIFSSSDKGMK